MHISVCKFYFFFWMLRTLQSTLECPLSAMCKCIYEAPNNGALQSCMMLHKGPLRDASLDVFSRGTSWGSFRAPDEAQGSFVKLQLRIRCKAPLGASLGASVGVLYKVP